MTNLVIWGGYGGANLGDEAILWALSLLLRKLRPGAKLYVIVRGGISAEVAKLYAEWGLQPISARSLRCLSILRKARLIVGGGQLVDDKGLGWPVGWTSLFLLANRLLGNRPLVLFIGAEPVKRRLVRYLVRIAYSLSSVCVCRDADSAEILTTLGIHPAKVWCGADVVFSLAQSLLPSWRCYSSTSRRIGILVARDVNRLSDNIDRLALLTTALVRSGFQITFVGHDLREAYDLGALARLEAAYKGSPNVTSCRARTVQGVAELYSQCDAVISARMHPLILSSLIGTLPIAIMDTRKVRHLVARLGIPTLDLNDEPERQSALICELLAKHELHSREIESHCADCAEAVEHIGGKALSLDP